jgi:hypothetical protein
VPKIAEGQPDDDEVTERERGAPELPRGHPTIDFLEPRRGSPDEPA